MTRTKRLLLVGTGVLALVYLGIIGVLAYSENSMIYVSAGAGKRGRPVPQDAAIPWDTLTVPDGDGVPVLLLRSPRDSASYRPWAIFFHGNAGFIGSRSSVERYQLLRDAGFNVLAVEYRGYGASVRAGTPSEEGITADARAALLYLTGAERVRPEFIAAYGWSLGSGPAARLAADARLGALITEGAFTSLPDVGASMYPWLPVRLIMRNRFDNVEAASRLQAPWLLFHGRRDSEIPFAHAQALADAAGTERLIPLDADHGDGVIGDRETALAALRQLEREMHRRYADAASAPRP